jgi:hypothetical protein
VADTNEHQRTGPKRPLMAVQVGARSFADEGVADVLDVLQERAGANAIHFAAYTYTRGTGGRQVPGWPLPDHGGQEYDAFVGGNFARTHPQFYRKTRIQDFQAPDEGTAGTDWLEAILPECEQRGIGVYAWAVERFGMHLAGGQLLLQRDVYGRPMAQPCYANPDYRYWMLGLMEDYAKSYPVAGIMWGSERRGPFEATALGGVPYCFCEHCLANGRAAGLDVGRARAGFEQLHEFVREARGGTRPRDGYYVAFWRVLLRFPELLQWERLWFEQQQRLHQEIYGTVKTADPQKTVGWHVWHQISFSPVLRAEWDFSALRRYSDWIKPVLYNNCAGSRYHKYLADWHRSAFADGVPEDTYRFATKVLGHDEAPYAQLPESGWSAAYVEYETRRTVEDVDDEIPVYPGIDVDIPSGECPTTPERVRDAVVAAFRGGAKGVILSRKYSEMRLDHLSGAGAALKELGFA